MKAEMRIKKQIFYRILIIGSFIFNIVFIGMWMAHAVPRHFMKFGQCGFAGNAHQQCALQKTLSLNDSQWTLLKSGVESLRESRACLCREMAKHRMTLLDELEKTPTDSAALFACIDRIVACQKNLQALIANHILEEKKMLTQDQQRRFFNTLRSNMSCAGFPVTVGVAPFENGKQTAPEGACKKNNHE